MVRSLTVDWMDEVNDVQPESPAVETAEKKGHLTEQASRIRVLDVQSYNTD